jgi:hypothetical protein
MLARQVQPGLAVRKRLVHVCPGHNVEERAADTDVFIEGGGWDLIGRRANREREPMPGILGATARLERAR